MGILGVIVRDLDKITPTYGNLWIYEECRRSHNTETNTD